MQWNNIKDKPSIQNKRKNMGQWLILLGTDGSKVEPFLYDFEDQSFGQSAGSEIKDITHWMYPEEVFSPIKMLKLTEILKNPCCHKV